jgi:hypothetical protein
MRFPLPGLPVPDAALPVAGALMFSAGAAIAREHAESVAAAVMLHWMCLAALLGFAI